MENIVNTEIHNEIATLLQIDLKKRSDFTAADISIIKSYYSWLFDIKKFQAELENRDKILLLINQINDLCKYNDTCRITFYRLYYNDIEYKLKSFQDIFDKEYKPAYDKLFPKIDNRCKTCNSIIVAEEQNELNSNR